MATIALYAGKMNRMPSLIGEVRKSVDDYSSELFSLKSKALNIRKSVCNLDDVIGMVQISTQIQEKKIESLENFSQKTEEFTAEVVRIDEEVAAVINQNKEDFYNKYNRSCAGDCGSGCNRRRGTDSVTYSIRSSCRDSSEYKLSGGSNCGGINDWGGCAEYC